MIQPILIVAGDVELRAELNDSDAAQAIYDSLPIVASGNRWGEEIYFEIPVGQPLSENATAEVAVGDLGYWPPAKRSASSSVAHPCPPTTSQELPAR
jgi:hypothetical protein